MKQVTIAGAGISGLTAAIILARRGYAVTVLEQTKSIGAAVLFQRGKPLSVSSMEWFPRQLREDEGLMFPDWHMIETPAVPGWMRLPRNYCPDLRRPVAGTPADHAKQSRIRIK